MNNLDTYSDTPEKAVDLLGMDTRCRGIANFISSCDTPMTVAIQGDWGTGKTTTMQLILDELKQKKGEEHICSVWFNTWQFSVLGDEKKQIIYLMKMLLSVLGEKAEETLTPDEFSTFGSNNTSLKKKINDVVSYAGTLTGTFSKNLIKASNVGAFFDTYLDMAEYNKDIYSAPESTAVDEFEIVVELKRKMEEQIAIMTGDSTPYDRIYVFIDDLDRLEPISAVELMEGIKNFIDCKGCVFVLAVDSEVVERGLQAKYGMEKYGAPFDAEKSKKFFDKIIQVPFKLPVNTYDITQYIKTFLGNRNSQHMADKYTDLINGFDETNPRTIKRSFNLFRLQEKIEESSGRQARDGLDALRQYALMLFKLEAEKLYEQLFVGIVKQSRTGDPDAPYDLDQAFQLLSNAVNGDSTVDGVQISGKDLKRIIAVMKVFFEFDGTQFSDDQNNTGTNEFVRIIQESSPIAEEDTGANITAARTLQYFYNLTKNLGTITVNPPEAKLDGDIVQLTQHIRNTGILYFSVVNNDKTLLTFRTYAERGTVNITFYDVQSPADLFGYYSSFFFDKKSQPSYDAENRFGYYDNTRRPENYGGKPWRSHLTVAQVGLVTGQSDKDDPLISVITHFLRL